MSLEITIKKASELDVFVFLYSSEILNNAQSITRVIEIINNGGTSHYGPIELAAIWVWSAAIGYEQDVFVEIETVEYLIDYLVDNNASVDFDDVISMLDVFLNESIEAMGDR